MNIKLHKPSIDNEEIKAVTKVLESRILTSSNFDGGERVRELEDSIKKYVGIKHAIALNSGTSSLYSALLSLDLKEQDEVLLPSFTFISTWEAVIESGLKPILIDINQTDYTIDISDIKNKINSKTKAIIPVHLYGNPVNMDELLEISNKNNIQIIEDACQSLGSKYNNKYTGTLGNLGIFSFSATKIITSGEGGMVVTNDNELANKIKLIRNHGFNRENNVVIKGTNYTMPEIEAAIGHIQLKKIEKLIQIRKKNADILNKLINNKNIIKPHEGKENRNNWYLYTINVKVKRDYLLEQLKKSGVEARIYYNPPIHKYSIYKNKSQYNVESKVNLPNTEWAAEHVLTLPIHPELKYEELKYIADIVNSCDY